MASHCFPACDVPCICFPIEEERRGGGAVQGQEEWQWLKYGDRGVLSEIRASSPPLGRCTSHCSPWCLFNKAFKSRPKEPGPQGKKP